MKSKFLALFMLIIPLLSCSQTRLLGSFPTGDEISKVFVGPALLSMAGDIGGDYADELKDMMKEIKSIEAYSCENAKMYATVDSEFDKLLRSLNTEEIVYSEEDGEKSLIYIVTAEGSSEPDAVLIYNSDRSEKEINIVVIHGKIDISSLAGANK